MKRTTTWLALLALQSGAGLARAQTPAEARAASLPSISVTGTGKVELTPDRATFSAGVQSVAASLPAALQDNNSRVAAMVGALRKLGLTDKEIRTSQVSIFPQQDQQPGKPPRITGYQVSNNVTVVSSRTDEVGRYLQAAVEAGANTVSGLSFVVSDPARGREQALQAAYADARAKAETLAKASGRSVGAALWISEGAAMPPPRPVAYARMAADSFQAVPVEPGMEEVAFSVSVTFELK